MYFFTFISAFILSCILSKTLIKVLTTYAILDVPTARSNHSTPIPRGGGIAIVITVILFLAMGIHFKAHNLTILYFIVSLLIVSIVSFIDDLKSLSIPTRIVFQLCAILFILSSVSNSTQIPFDKLQMIGMIFGMLAFINFYNFMDGIDGSATCEAIHISASIFVIAMILDLPQEVVFVSATLAGAALGFILFNWHPAKIFLGDVGSISLGLICGWMLLHIALHGHVLTAIIIPLYYLADSSITIFLRLIRGEKIWLAHSQHFFQKAVRKGQSHAKVAKKIIKINLCLFGLSICSIHYPITSLVFATLIVAIFLFYLQTRRASRA